MQRSPREDLDRIDELGERGADPSARVRAPRRSLRPPKFDLRDAEIFLRVQDTEEGGDRLDLGRVEHDSDPSRIEARKSLTRRRICECRAVVERDGALEGLTRRTVLEAAPQLGLPARERTLGKFDLFDAEEAFLTGSGAGIVPVTSLDGQPVGSGLPGSWWLRFREAYAEAAERLGVAF